MSNKKGINTVVWIILIILFTVLGIFLGEYLSNKLDIKVFEDKKVINDKNETKKDGKITNNNGLVYDIDYKSKNVEEKYKDAWGRYVYASDIKLPYINIDSKSVKEINKEIEKIYNKLIEEYINASKSSNEVDKLYNSKSSYTYSINDNLLSVLIEVDHVGTDVEEPDYYAYNIDLNTNKRLSYSEVLENTRQNNLDIDFTDENITKIMTYVINNKTEEFLKKIYPDISTVKLDGMNLSDIKAYNMKNYTDSVSDGSIIYFLDYKGQLNVIVKMLTGAGSLQGYNTMLTITEDDISFAMRK